MRSTTKHRHNKVREAYKAWVKKVSKNGKKIYSEEHIITSIAEELGYSTRYTEDIIYQRI